MTGITSSISNLIQSIYGIFAGVINTVLSGVQGVFAVFGTLIANIADLARSAVSLVLGNIVIIGVVVAAFVGYSAYQQRRGRQVQGSTFTKKIS